MSPPSHRFSPLRRLGAAALLALAPAVFADGVKPGQTFPSLEEARVAGPLPDSAGQVVLVDFWASWCAPCQASFPALAKIFTDYSPRGLVIVAVSQDDATGPYEAFVKKYRPTFPTVRDQTHALARAVDVPAMPTSYLVDRSGRVRFVHAGFHGDSTVREIRTEIEQLLAEKTSP